MNIHRGYKFKYLGNYAYGITDDDRWLFAIFIVDSENYVIYEVATVYMVDFFNGNAVSEVEKVCDELASHIYGFWSKYHDKINVSSHEKIKVKLFEVDPCSDKK